jgi:Protein of unknown function (DUF2690)
MSKTNRSIYISWFALIVSALGLFTSLFALLSPKAITTINKMGVDKFFATQELAGILSVLALIIFVFVLLLVLFREASYLMLKSSFVLIVFVVLITFLSGSFILSYSLKTPSCSGNSCTELDPKFTGCSRSSETISTYLNKGIMIDLQFSLRCRTVWTRATAPSKSRLYVEFFEGKQLGSYLVLDNKDKLLYFGNMAFVDNGDKPIRACIHSPFGNPICTDYVVVSK